MGKSRPGGSLESVVVAPPPALLPSTSKACATGPDPRVRLRYLCPADIPAVKSLCAEIFPIESDVIPCSEWVRPAMAATKCRYPEYWYNEIATNPGYFSLAAVFVDSGGGQSLIGILIAEVKRLSVCSNEDRDMLAKSFPANTAVAYILSLGVTARWRRVGIASRLLEHLLAYVNNGVGTPAGEVKAVYLHVLCENRAAIRFYECRNFRRHKRLGAYYQIRSVPRDGFTYVLYVNGGRATEGPLDCARGLGRALLCLPALLRCLIRRPWAALAALRGRLRPRRLAGLVDC